jgi:acetyl esterase/lipase
VHERRIARYGDGWRFVEIDQPTRPGGQTPPVGVVLVHGGFWRREKTVESLHPVVADLSGAGLTVGNVEYRTVDEQGVWPHCRDDVVTAVRTFGRGTGIPLSRTVLVGHSAGGHLALLAGRRLAGLGAVVALAPITDLVAAEAENLGDGAVGALLPGRGDDPGTRIRRLSEASPLHLGGLSGHRTVLVHGTEDQAVPLSQSQRYARRHADSVRLVIVDGARHMHLVKPERPAWAAVRQELLTLAQGLARGGTTINTDSNAEGDR